MRRVLASAPWRRAPVQLRRAPSALVTVVGGALLLGFVASAQPLTVSASGAAALHADLTNGCPFDVGLRIQRELAVPGVDPSTSDLNQPSDVTIDAATRLIQGAGSGVAHVGSTVTTIFTSGQIPNERTGGVPERVQLVARTGAYRELGLPSASISSDPGIWLPDTTASLLKVAAGDEIHVTMHGQATQPIRVAGVFPNLIYQRRSRFWCSMERAFTETFPFTPDPVAIVDQPGLISILQQTNTPSATTWFELPPDAKQWTESNAEATIAALRNVKNDSDNPATPFGNELGVNGISRLDAGFTINHSTKTTRTVNGLTGATALATVLLIIAILRQAARAWLVRTEAENTILFIRGASTPALIVKQLLTQFPALLVGVAGGYAIAIATLNAYGPSDLVDSDARSLALRYCGLALLLCIAIIAIDTLAWLRRARRAPFQHVEPRGSATWLWVALALSGAAYYELNSHATAVSNNGRADGLALLFPMLLVATGCGLLARGLFRDRLTALRLERWPAATRLAIRRLAQSGGRSAAVVASSGLAIGTFMIAGTTYDSLTATANAKATLGPGSEQTFLVVDDGHVVQPDNPFAGVATTVLRTSDASIVIAGHRPLDLLVVDESTFERAAYWDDSFSSSTLATLLRRLHEDQPQAGHVAMLAVGDVPDSAIVELPTATGHTSVTADIVARPSAFPGYKFGTDHPLVVVEAPAVAPLGVTGPSEIWMKTTDPSARRTLEHDGFTIITGVLASSRLDTGALTATLWSLDFIKLLGALSAVIAIGGVLGYFVSDRRQRQMSDAFIRMCVRTSVTRVAAILEVGVMLVFAAAAGLVLAVLGASIVLPLLDPVPVSPPDVLLRFDFAGAGLAIAGVAALSLVCALHGSRRRTLDIVYEAGRHED